MLELSSGLNSDVSLVAVTTVVRCVKCGQKEGFSFWDFSCVHEYGIYALFGDPLISCIVLLHITAMSSRGQ